MADLDALITRLRAVPAAVRASYPAMAEELLGEIRGNIAAQRGPDGEPWPATKDGKPALQGATGKLSYSVEGSTIWLVLTGIDARHHFGSVKGGRVRPILPRTISSLKRSRARMEKLARARVKAALQGAA